MGSLSADLAWAILLVTPFSIGRSLSRRDCFACEVLNLTRNVGIEGTPTGRAHVFIVSRRPQAIAHTAIRWTALSWIGGLSGLEAECRGSTGRAQRVASVKSNVNI